MRCRMQVVDSGEEIQVRKLGYVQCFYECRRLALDVLPSLARKCRLRPQVARTPRFLPRGRESSRKEATPRPTKGFSITISGPASPAVLYHMQTSTVPWAE